MEYLDTMSMKYCVSEYVNFGSCILTELASPPSKLRPLGVLVVKVQGMTACKVKGKRDRASTQIHFCSAFSPAKSAPFSC